MKVLSIVITTIILIASETITHHQICVLAHKVVMSLLLFVKNNTNTVTVALPNTEFIVTIFMITIIYLAMSCF